MKYFCIIILLCSVCRLAAQTPQQLTALLPNVDGWTISESVEVFDAENLFDRINGAAPLFIENNFREMTSMEYLKVDDYITIQAYRHENPEDAFGMYTSERSTGLEHFRIGGEAQGNKESIYFFAGNIYVKMWGSSSEDISLTLQTIAKKFADNIKLNADYPPIIKAFPDKEKIPYSESYITSNFIGHTFLNGVFNVKYKKDEQSFMAFVINAKTNDKAKDIISKYLSFTRQTLDINEGTMIIKDRYNGDIPILWKGCYIFGLIPDGNEIKDYNLFLDDLAKNVFGLME